MARTVERLIEMRENLLRKFEGEYPQLKEVLDHILNLEKQADHAMQAGNVAEAKRLNDVADAFENKLKERISPKENAMWVRTRYQLRMIEKSLKGKAG